MWHIANNGNEFANDSYSALESSWLQNPLLLLLICTISFPNNFKSYDFLESVVCTLVGIIIIPYLSFSCSLV